MFGSNNILKDAPNFYYTALKNTVLFPFKNHYIIFNSNKLLKYNNLNQIFY